MHINLQWKIPIIKGRKNNNTIRWWMDKKNLNGMILFEQMKTKSKRI